jgi:SAM-dependent methyltransferase
MPDSHAPEHFSEWNEQMIRQYDPDVFHHHPRGIVRWVENRRIAAVLSCTEARPEHSILDVGCGAGNILARLPGERRTGLDLSRYMIERARQRLGGRVQLLLGDAEQLPFPDASFERVIASSLFSHVLHPERVAAELKRVLKPGGRIVVSVSDEEQIERGLRWARSLRFDRWLTSTTGEARAYNVEYHLHRFSLPRMREVLGADMLERGLTRVPTYIFPVHWVAIYETGI